MEKKKQKKNYEEMARRRRLSGIGGKADVKQIGMDTAKNVAIAIVSGALGSALGNWGLAAGAAVTAAGAYLKRPEVTVAGAGIITAGITRAAAAVQGGFDVVGGANAATEYAVEGMKAALFLPHGGQTPAKKAPEVAVNGLGRVPNRSYMSVPRNIEQLYGDDRVLTLPLTAAAQANDIINRTIITAQPAGTAAAATTPLRGVGRAVIRKRLHNV
jgi:hypothetical protein